GVAPGSYQITAVATDDQGVSTASAPVSVTVASMSPLPPPWIDQDVGAVPKAGSAATANGIFTLTGSGSDIWYASDQFHYAYQALSGDGEIVARVATQQNTNVWAKAGVMIRESTNPGSPYAFMLVTPGSGVASQHRLAPSINATGPTVSGVAAPVW